jgi:hypothetical protein
MIYSFKFLIAVLTVMVPAYFLLSFAAQFLDQTRIILLSFTLGLVLKDFVTDINDKLLKNRNDDSHINLLDFLHKNKHKSDH